MSKGQFSQKIKAFNEKALVKTQATAQTIANELFFSVIMDTPVLDGRLRGNWVAQNSKPFTGTIERFDKIGSETIGAILPEISKLKLDGTIFLSNNLPYAHRIEYEGYSGKSPDGMVRKNVTRIQGIVKEESRKAR